MTKYNAKKIVVDGVIFDSKSEAEFYKLLKKAEKAGKVKDIELQPVFVLQDKYKHNNKTVKAITYIADFKFYDVEKDKHIVVDVKGMATEVANIKRKMFNYLYKDLELIWVVANKKYSDGVGYIEYDKLKKLRRANKNK